MIKLFSSKLFQVALDVNPADWHGLISVSAKISVLSIFALISTQIICVCSALNLVAFLFRQDNDLEKFVYYEIVMGWLSCLDSTINVVCVYLSMPYPASENCYIKMCSGCHALCLLMTKKRIKGKQRDIRNDYRPLTDL